MVRYWFQAAFASNNHKLTIRSGSNNLLNLKRFITHKVHKLGCQFLVGNINMKKEFANQFALEWIHAWNSKDINEITSHYAEEFEMTSPVIKDLINEGTGALKGKESIKAYWLKAIKANQNLHFTLINVYIGVNSIVINYKGHRGLSSEVLHFNEDKKVERAYAHYIQE